MRKLKSSILALSLLSSVVGFGGITSNMPSKNFPNKASEKGYLELSNDKDFCELFNSVLSFTYSVHKSKANNSFTNYVNNKATESETSELLFATGYKSEAEIKAFFSRLNKVEESLSAKYQLTNTQLSKNLLKESLVNAMRSGKIKAIFMFEPDCASTLANATAACYIAQEICLNSNPSGGEYVCTIAWTNCILAAWIAYETCSGA